MELRLVEYFADEFNKQIGNGVDIRNSPKSMAKLKKQVKRAKEILSANTMAPISVDFSGVDWRRNLNPKVAEINISVFDNHLLDAGAGGFLIGRTLAVLVTMTVATSMAARDGPVPVAGYQIFLEVWLDLSLLNDALAIAGQVKP
ncbi:hypothetical protein AgCh_011990 [Apium graveolens]